MGRDALEYLLELIEEGKKKAYEGFRYDEATVLYETLDEIKKHLTNALK